MKKSLSILFILICIMFNYGCEKIVLKKPKKTEAPFNWDKGILKIQIYKISYPEDIVAKEKFYNDLDSFITKLYLYKNKVSLVFDENFLKDYESIKKGDYISGEEVLYKVASSLTDSEKLDIKKITGKDIEYYKNTTQEYLNLQMLFWINTSGTNIVYDEKKLYTELDKEELINAVKKRRLDLIKKSAQVKMEIIVQLDDFYEMKNKTLGYKDYYMSKDIMFSKNYEYDKQTSKYAMPVLITNMKNDDIEKILYEKIEFKNKVVLIKSDKYSGYKLDKKDIILFYGGENIKNDYFGYNIQVEIINSDFEKVLNINNANSMGTIFGGK